MRPRFHDSLRQRFEIGRATPAMDKARRPQNGKKKDINQGAPTPRKRDIGENSRDQPEPREGQEAKNRVTGIEFFKLAELERLAQTIRMQVEESHGEIDRREADTVDDKQSGKL